MGDVKAVIQAGGRGTRLAPYSTVLPKALMPIGKGTVVDNLLDQFAAAGVREVVITVSSFGPLIRSYCGDGSRWGVTIDYVGEDEPLGTIGPLSALRDRLDGPFFVSNSDVYTDLDLTRVLEFHDASPGPLTVVLTPQTVNIPYGVITHDGGRVVGFQEKPTEVFHVSTGIYCMSPEVFDHIPATGAFGFDQLMAVMLEKGRPINAYEHDGRWVDIGRIEDLRRAQTQLTTMMDGMGDDVADL
ncbi:sugar phosphate nucleotidyltransferase [Pseudonocardia petroleophila]